MDLTSRKFLSFVGLELIFLAVFIIAKNVSVVEYFVGAGALFGTYCTANVAETFAPSSSTGATGGAPLKTVP